MEIFVSIGRTKVFVYENIELLILISYSLTFYCARARPDFIWSYHDSLLSETRGKHAVGVI